MFLTNHGSPLFLILQTSNLLFLTLVSVQIFEYHFVTSGKMSANAQNSAPLLKILLSELLRD